MSNYAANKISSRTRNNGKPSLTDQSQAKDTDINIIVNRFLKTGTAPGAPVAPIHGDFTELPQDLRAFIETSRTIHKHRNRLPEQLRNMPVDELMRLTPDALARILAPPATPPAPTQGEPT